MDLGLATGVVEYVSVRITHVRDVNGTLWYVRNGEITRIGNMSMGWSRVIVDLAISADADVTAVETTLLDTAKELGRRSQVAYSHHRAARDLGPRSRSAATRSSSGSS